MGNQTQKEDTKFKIPFFKRQQDQTGYNQMKDQISQRCKCTIKTRVIGFFICCICGWVLSIFAIISFFLKHDTTQFAILYSIGQLLNIIGSCFLAGPIKQMKSMTNSKRIILSILYVGSTIATIVLALVLPQHLSYLILISLIIQVVSYFLYTLSYIPFGQRLLKAAFRFAID